MSESASREDVEGHASAGVGPTDRGSGVSPAEVDERMIGAAPLFSPRQQSGIGQQSGDETLDATLASEQQGWRRGIPSPESNPTETRRTTTRFPTSSMLHPQPTVTTTLPRLCPCSTYRWASAISSRG